MFYFTKGGCSLPNPPAISETVAPMNLKFCRVLETSLNVLEMLKLFLLGYHSNSSKERCFMGKIARFQPKIPIFKLLSYSQSQRQHYGTFLANSPIIAHFKNIIFVWVGKPDVREGQAEKWGQN